MIPFVENPEAVGDPNQTPRVRLTGDDVLDLAYDHAARVHRAGKRFVVAVEPDDRLTAAEAKLAEVRALAERWYRSDDSTYLDYCGRKLLELLGESSDVSV